MNKEKSNSKIPSVMQVSKQVSFPRTLFFIFMIVTILTFTGGYFFYQFQKKQLFKDKKNELAAISELKIKQIVQWKLERLGDANLIADNSPLIKQLAFFLGKNYTGTQKQELLSWMKSYTVNYDYSEVILLDTQGIMQLAYPTHFHKTGPFLKSHLKEAYASGRLILSDFHISDEINYSHLDLVIPLKNRDKKDTSIVGFIILRIDPEKFLFPLIQTWPVPSKTSESLLIRKEGKEVVYLNELRHRKNTALKLRFPVSEEKLPAAMAARGFEGFVEGLDYRNVPVVGLIKKIPDSPWFLINKTDKEEIEAPLLDQKILIFLILSLLILSVAGIVGFWWWNQQVRFYQGLYQSELDHSAALQHFNYIAKFANDIILLVDKDLNIIRFNDRVLETYGYSKDELTHMNIDHLRTPEAVTFLRNQIRMLKDNESAIYESIHQRKDGTIFPVEISARGFNIDGHDFYQMIGRDITDRKKAEDAQHKSENRYRGLFEHMVEGYSYCQMIYEDNQPQDWIYITVNEAFGNLTGLKDVTGKRVSEVIPGIKEADPELFNIYARVALTGKHEKFEMFVKALNMWFSLSVYSPDKGFFVAVFDVITERKNTEIALRQNEENFSKAFRSSPAALLITRLNDGRYMELNDAYSAIVGYERDELIDHLTTEFNIYLNPGDRQAIVEQLRAKGSVRNFETSIRHRSGAIRYVMAAQEFVTFNGESCIMTSLLDITVRKQIEEELRNSEKRFRSTLDNMLEGCQILDSNWVYLYLNDAADIHNRRPKEELLGRKYMDMWPGIENTEVFRNIKHCLTERVSHHMENEFIFPDGAMGWFDLSIQPVPEGVFILSIDITERKKAEEALFESEDKFRNVFEHDPVGKSLTAIDGTINFNWAFYKMLGYSFEELKGLNWKEISHPEDIEMTQKNIDALLKGEAESVRFLKRYLHKNGSVIRADVSTFLQRDKNGKPLYYITSVVDMTHQYILTEKLRETNQYLESLYNYANVPIIVWNNDLMISRFNHAFENLSGYSADEVLGKKIDILFSKEKSEFYIELIKKTIGGERWEIVEIEIQRKDGDSKIVLWNSANILDKDGENIIATIAQGYDITERKLSEEALRQSEKLYRAIGESIDYGVWVCEPDGRNIYASESFLNLVGITQEQCSNFGWGDVLHPDDADRTISAWKECVNTGGNWDIEHRFRGVDGNWHHVLARGVPVRNERGQIIRWAGINLDINNLKRAEEEIRKLNSDLEQRVTQRTAQLEAANKELEAFSYSVSHDLRAPLRALDGFTVILLEEYKTMPDQERERICNIIRSNTIKMGRLIDDLLEFSRLNRNEIAFTTIDMDLLARSVYLDLTNTGELGKIKFIVDMLPASSGDITMIKQVWVNLVSNAIKYSSKNEQPEIRIRAEQTDNETIYYIIDNGVGFNMQYKDKLFGVFQRLHSFKEFEGTGVGLAIVQRIINRHGGRVWAEGEVGKGATFYFTLPVKFKNNNV